MAAKDKVKADKKYRYPQNADGAFYVEHDCLFAMKCIDEAPQFFAEVEEMPDVYSYVHTQPKTEKELAAAYEAMLRCPNRAIGDDGDL
jgi:ferredoxin